MDKLSDIKFNLPKLDSTHVYKCGKCRDSGFIFGNEEAWPCECRAAEIWRYRRKKAGITEMMAGQSFDNFDLKYYCANDYNITKKYRKEAKAAVDACMNFVSDCVSDKHCRGLFLHGAYNLGKSHLAAACANELLKCNIEVLFVVVPELLDMVRETFDSDSVNSEADIMHRVQNAAVLILDDIGAYEDNKWARSVLFKIIEYRRRNSLPCLITSNLTYSELIDTLGERIVTRIMDTTSSFVLTSEKHIRKEIYCSSDT